MNKGNYHISIIIIIFLWSFAAAYWDTEKGEVILCDSVDISVAVATDKVIE